MQKKWEWMLPLTLPSAGDLQMLPLQACNWIWILYGLPGMANPGHLSKQRSKRRTGLPRSRCGSGVVLAYDMSPVMVLGKKPHVAMHVAGRRLQAR